MSGLDPLPRSRTEILVLLARSKEQGAGTGGKLCMNGGSGIENLPVLGERSKAWNRRDVTVRSGTAE